MSKILEWVAKIQEETVKCLEHFRRVIIFHQLLKVVIVQMFQILVQNLRKLDLAFILQQQQNLEKP